MTSATQPGDGAGLGPTPIDNDDDLLFAPEVLGLAPKLLCRLAIIAFLWHVKNEVLSAWFCFVRAAWQDERMGASPPVFVESAMLEQTGHILFEPIDLIKDVEAGAFG